MITMDKKRAYKAAKRLERDDPEAVEILTTVMDARDRALKALAELATAVVVNVDPETAPDELKLAMLKATMLVGGDLMAKVEADAFVEAKEREN